MPRIHWIVAGTVLLLLVTGGLRPEEAGAYDSPCHTYITDQADSVWTFPELREWLVTVSDGAGCEDSQEHIYENDGPCGHTVRHFWNADDPDNFDEHLCLGYSYANAWVKGRSLIDRAQAFYWNYINTGSVAEQELAYHYLGHACHLIGDMAAPCHAKVDFHDGVFTGDSCYEDWMAGKDDGQTSVCDVRWSWQDAVAKWGAFEVGIGNVYNIINYLGDDCWEPRDLQASFYYLMYTTNQTADYFASDGYDGDVEDRLGLMSYAEFPDAPIYWFDLIDNDEDPDNDAHGHLTNIADYCYTYAMSSTAALYRAWRDHWDHVAPNTAIDIAGPDEVHDGWRPGDVVAVLMADDNSGGSAIHDSGVEEIRWRFNDDDWQSARVATIPLAITDEGRTELRYRSMDRFANLEVLHAEVIRIDKTPPVVTIVSPSPIGNYMTSGTLTIDYETGDVPSGIHMVTAEMDGEPVADGQVFDDLSTMAGFHTVTVTAEDKAGNLTTESVTFSIKIHATAEFVPGQINLKSAGGTIKCYIGFPPEYDVNDIDPGTVMQTVNGQDVAANASPCTVVHREPQGPAELLVKFEREPICEALGCMNGDVVVALWGELTNGTEFLGTTVLEVFCPGNDIDPSSMVGAFGSTPNPFNASTAIHYAIPGTGPVQVSIYDFAGRLVRTIVDQSKQAGDYVDIWDGRDDTGQPVASGIYFTRIEYGESRRILKLMLLR